MSMNSEALEAGFIWFLLLTPPGAAKCLVHGDFISRDGIGHPIVTYLYESAYECTSNHITRVMHMILDSCESHPKG